MACIITFQSVRGINFITPQKPGAIVLSGTAESCNDVVVGTPGFLSVTVPVINGNWEATIETGGLIECGVQIKVSAGCASDPACESPTKDWFVECNESTCPSKVILEIRDSTGTVLDLGTVNCLPPGQYTVDVIEPPLGSGTYWWSIDGDVNHPEIGGNQNQPTITINLPENAERTVSVSVTPSQANCPPPSDGITLTSCATVCPTLTGIKITGCWPGQVTLEALGNDLQLAEGFDWRFGDGVVSSGDRVISHTYGTNGPFVVSVTVIRRPGCEPRTQDVPQGVRVPECGGPPPPPPPNGGSRLCCFLIYGWLVTFVSIWFTTEYLPALLSAVGTSTALLVAWFFKCQDCGWKFWTKKFWKCINPFTNCCFLRWTILGHEIAILLVSWAIAASSYGLPGPPPPPSWILAVLSGSLALWTVLYHRADCKVYPIIFVPSTWPPCKCRR